MDSALAASFDFFSAGSLLDGNQHLFFPEVAELVEAHLLGADWAACGPASGLFFKVASNGGKR